MKFYTGLIDCNRTPLRIRAGLVDTELLLGYFDISQGFSEKARRSSSMDVQVELNIQDSVNKL